jgi:ketosteroid isomerase-like protein
LSRARTAGALAGIAIAAVACSGETVAQPPAAPVNWQSFSRPATDAGANSPTAKESTIAQQYLDALASPGQALLGHLLDGDAHFAFPGPGLDDVHGKDAVVQAHAALFGAFDRRRFVASRLLRTASEQSIEWTMSGVQARDWMGVATTEKPVSIRGATLLWTRDDGMLRDVHVYFDVAAVKALLGAGPKELGGLAAPSMPSGSVQTIDASGQEPDNAVSVRAALDAFDSNNENAFVDAMAEDVEVHTLERDEPRRGREEQRAYFRSMIKAIAQLDTTTDSTLSVGPYAIVEYSITGEQIGPIGWIPLQSNRVVKLHVFEIDEIANARITRASRYENPSEMATPGP